MGGEDDMTFERAFKTKIGENNPLPFFMLATVVSEVKKEWSGTGMSTSIAKHVHEHITGFKSWSKDIGEPTSFDETAAEWELNYASKLLQEAWKAQINIFKEHLDS